MFKTTQWVTAYKEADAGTLMACPQSFWKLKIYVIMLSNVRKMFFCFVLRPNCCCSLTKSKKALLSKRKWQQCPCCTTCRWKPWKYSHTMCYTSVNRHTLLFIFSTSLVVFQCYDWVLGSLLFESVSILSAVPAFFAVLLTEACFF